MKPLSFALLLLMSAFTCKAATFSGTVRDSEGAVIAKAHVVIHWDPAGSNYLGDNVGIKEDITVSTDSVNSEGPSFTVSPPASGPVFAVSLPQPTPTATTQPNNRFIRGIVIIDIARVTLPQSVFHCNRFLRLIDRLFADS